ncbi:MAG TPA: sulfite exporter TauE/SafE family protein [Pirellulales bacterium]|jgi:hypothetical protein|nr:sulfite exporter TauE/SafE family protein [Pirellulales bacterium]
MLWYQDALLFVAALLAGGMNSVAGGGTLLTFPTLLWAGGAAGWVNAALVANATSTVALWPGALSSFWGYRGQLPSDRRETILLAIPSTLGGAIGATILTLTSESVFKSLVPYLILLATLLFVAQAPLAKLRSRWAERNRGARGLSEAEIDEALDRADTPGLRGARRRWLAVLAFQFLVGVYGGYFGAGIGILMLAGFSWLGFTNIHHMNALKNLIGAGINGITAVILISNGFVHWPVALLMSVAAILGGYAGAGIAQRIGQKWVRRIVIAIGFSLTAYMLLHQFRG